MPGSLPEDTEVVESYLMEFESQVEAEEQDFDDSDGEGIYLDDEGEKTDANLGEVAGKAEAIDPMPLRDHARRLLDDMRLTPEYPSARLSFLRSRWDELERLLIDMVSACDPHPAVAKLREALGNATCLREALPDDDAVHAAWTAIESALCEYLGEPAPRTAIWK